MHCGGYFAYANLSPVEIYAAGDTNEEILELQVDGVTVATFNDIGGDAANGVFARYDYFHPSVITADQISIVYPNDGPAANGADRNLRVDKIVVNGETFETEAPTTYSTGTYDATTGCAPGAKRSEYLHCGGYFAYANLSPVEIYAAGDTNEEILELQVDGVTVATFNDIGGDAANGVFAKYDYFHPSVITADQISIAYPNDGPAANGADRNLRVDKIVVNGETFETEAPTTYSTGTYDAATGCAPGAKQSEYLHCGGHFSYAAEFNPGTIVFETAELFVDEQAGSVSIPVTRTNGSEGAVTLEYTTVGGSARGGSDFSTSAGQIVFLPGETAKSITIPIVNDGNDEEDEFFYVIGSNATGGAILSELNATFVAIYDEDGPPVVTLNSAAAFKGESFTLRAEDLYTYDQNSSTTELTYRLTSLPTEGTLWRGVNQLLLNSTFTQSDVNNNQGDSKFHDTQFSE